MASPAYMEQLAQAQTRQTEDIAARAEDRRALTEALLGTEEQVAGQLGGISAEALPYSQRYALDPTLALQSAALLPGQKKKKKKSIFKKLASVFTGGLSDFAMGGNAGFMQAIPGIGPLMGSIAGGTGFADKKMKAPGMDPNVW